jgi:hypothetical protein
MKKTILHMAFIGLLTTVITGCSKNDYEEPQQEEDLKGFFSYGDSAAVIGKLNEFRQAAGNPVNAVPGATGGRREINWDGVPADFLNSKPFPVDFFNAIDKAIPDGRKRGLVYVPANASLRVSDTNFSDINNSFGNEFKSFSKAKLFSANSTNISEVEFRVPGTNTKAYVQAFGVIFVDVDNAESTTLEAYDGEKLVARAKPVPADKGFSFVGITTGKARFTRIKIISGNTALAAGVTDGSSRDVVVMDDFIYSEPKAL